MEIKVWAFFQLLLPIYVHIYVCVRSTYTYNLYLCVLAGLLHCEMLLYHFVIYT